jgi:hypothetical protein
MVFAHLFEPGPLDNASGSALVLECARTLKALVDSGRIEHPKRSIRFMLGMECYGLIDYAFAHQDRLPHMVAGLNLDTVGFDYEISQAPVVLYRTHDSCASYTNALLGRILDTLLGEKERLVRWKEDRYIGSDGILSDPMIGVPTPSLIQYPARIWHNSAETVDKCDPRILGRMGVVAATYLYFIANAGSPEACWLADEVLVKAKRDIAEELQRKITAALTSDCSCSFAHAWSEIEGRIDYLKRREMEAIRSVLSLIPGDLTDAHEYVKCEEDDLSAFAQEEYQRAKRVLGQHSRMAGRGPLATTTKRALTEDEEEADGIIPERAVFGPLTLHTLPEAVRKQCPPGGGHGVYGGAPVLSWVDGRRSLLEVFRLVQQDMGKTDVGNLVEHFEFLERHGYVKLKRR